MNEQNRSQAIPRRRGRETRAERARVFGRDIDAGFVPWNYGHFISLNEVRPWKA
jgi:hypothetical protein